MTFTAKKLIHSPKKGTASFFKSNKGRCRAASCLATFMLLLPLAGHTQLPPNIHNPVLPGVADAGVIRFNGEYYIGGVFTKGSFYHSRDLVNWEGPTHVFSMDNAWTEGSSADDSQIHANDLNYVNGVFHQYWSVNYWGKDQHVVHIGHATANDILGPYQEPEKEKWFENRIDPALFMDDDGKPYLYMVKFTDGNTIWGRPMEDPWTIAGEPSYLFASLPDTWETLDNRVAEGPWVIKYRNKYYMMYNTNHTSPRWGNYMLGVAQADAPLAFNHGNKYPHPVVQSNQADMEETYVDQLKYSANEPGIFHFTREKPGKNWNSLSFDASSWQRGRAGFGSEKVKNSTSRKVETSWKSPEIWLRKSFVLDKQKAGNLMLRIHHDGETQVFLNGQAIYENEGSEYTNWNLDSKAAALLKQGENVLAIHSREGERKGFLDVALFDMQDQKGDDILFSPGQPNILRGPNGFEWWLIYMANKNQERRGQYINRVHFFNKRLTVDALTSTNTSGYHPLPAKPTFSDLFNSEQERQWQQNWEVRSGNWSQEKKELIQTGDHMAEALIKSKPATHYLFEAGVKMREQDAGKAGLLAWWIDENNWLKVVMDQQNKSWGYVRNVGGEQDAFSFSLPADFNYNVYHKLSVYKNADQLSIKIDDLPAPEQPVVKEAGLSGKGIPGLYAESAQTAFDGICYTIGWDEFDAQITGWEPSSTTDSPNASWEVSEQGITSPGEAGERAVFKGDALGAYEVSLQITAENEQGRAGIYPVYVDENNYLKTMFDFRDQKLHVSGRKQGRELAEQEISLEREQSYYADMKYSDFIEKHFTFDTPTYINALRLNKIPHKQPDTLIEDIHQKVNIFYKKDGRWHPLPNLRQTNSSHPGFDQITFDPVKAEGLKFVNRQADDHHFYIYKIWVNELFRQSYNLRVARHPEAMVFLVDGKEVLQLTNDYPASRIGLLTEGAKASFNGITLFDLGGR